MKIKMTLAAIMLICLSFTPAQSREAGSSGDQSIRICMVTGATPDAVVEQWYPMVTYLSEAVGHPFEIVISESYDEMIKDFEAGRVDIVIGGALNYVMTEDSANVVLLAEAKRPEDYDPEGVIIAGEESGISNLEDLKGKSFAFTDPYSTTGYLLPRIFMADAGIADPTKYFSDVAFSGHHAQSIESVASGARDAAAVAGYLAADAIRRGRAPIKIIAKTGPVPPEPAFARSSLDPELILRIKDALLTMHERMPPDIMHKLIMTRMAEVTDQDFDSVRKAEKKLKALSPMPYSVDYSLMPNALSKAVGSTKIKGVLWTMATPVAAAAALVIALLALKRRAKRELRLHLGLAVMAAMVLTALFAGWLASIGLSNELENISLGWQRSLNSFRANASVAAAADDARTIGSLIHGFAAQPGVLYAKVIRNGHYIADSEGRDTGYSIVPKIVSGTFHSGAMGAIEAVSFVTAGDKRYASIIAGFDLHSLKAAVHGWASASTLFTLTLAALGALISLYWSRIVTQPITSFAAAVNSMRAGKRPELRPCDRQDEIGVLMRGFAEMEAEIRGASGLLGQKSMELSEAKQVITSIGEMEPAIEDEIEIQGIDREETEDLRCKIAQIEHEIPRLKELRATRIIGDSPEFLKVVRDIIIRSRDTDPVLLYGESGSGKTGVAEAIHALSARSEKRLVEYNCAEFSAADPMIVLGKLFGYGRDSGLAGVGREGQKGILEEADGATLFLDEIALLPFVTQGALLLPLEGRPFNPAAGKGDQALSDVRIIFASNVDLEEEVRAGRFRHDLLRRIKSRGLIEIPPLRSRMEDMDALAAHFLDIWSTEKGSPMRFSTESLELLKKYDYHKFNIAELASAVKVAADNAHFKGVGEIRPELFGGDIADLLRIERSMTEAAIFDDDETGEIKVLRKHGFRIASSEQELGYSRDAKTLTNHLRGMAFKALVKTGFRADAASRAIAGDTGTQAASRVRRKIDLYLKNAEKLVSSGGEERLLNNLPQKYRQYVEEAVRRYKKT